MPIVAPLGGCWVTDDPAVLAAFVATALAQYAALEQTLAPFHAAISELEQDWLPRPLRFWRALDAAFGPLRTATTTCLALFVRQQSRADAPVPLVVTVLALPCRTALHNVQHALEEAGLLLTAYASQGNASESCQEVHLRQRQRVLRALGELAQQGREALVVGRTRLEQAAEEQTHLLAAASSPRCTTSVRRATVSRPPRLLPRRSGVPPTHDDETE